MSASAGAVRFELFDESQQSDVAMTWLAKQLNREPDAADLYNAGKHLYHLGKYAGAVVFLELYVHTPGAELPGHHLLGYAYYMIGQLDKAVEELKLCVNDGFDADWQLLTECQVELESRRKAAEQQQQPQQQEQPQQEQQEQQQDQS